MKKRLLMTPGPTPIPPDVLLAMAQPILHHRTPEFKEIFESCARDLQAIFATSEQVLMLVSTGTGAMEGSISNFMRRGDTIITVAGGKFGQRWSEIGRAYGLDVVELTVEWGKSVSVDAVADALASHPNARGVYLQASETSTGVSHPVQEIAALCRERTGTLCIVDGITAVGVQPVEMDAWGIDIVVSGSQKAFMLPPGLAFIACSEKAWGFAEHSDLPRYYFDLRKERKKQAGGQTAYTSAVSLIVGLRQVLNRMGDMGLTGLHAHHQRLALATQAGVKAIGLKLLADSPAWSVTAVYAPDGIDAGNIIKSMNAKGIKIAGGQDHLKGRIFRIGHLGWFAGTDIVSTLSTLETVLDELGHELQPGASVAAAGAILKED
jgi:aspartate aminotransferase-like enzyme